VTERTPHKENEMSDAKRFHVGDILSVTTGRLHGPHKMDGVYGILNHLTGQSLFTHQLPRALDMVQQFMWDQFPDLPRDGYHPARAESDDWREVMPCPSGVYQPQDPLAELSGMMRPDQQIVVVEAK
jgi:hypothetical protein